MSMPKFPEHPDFTLEDSIIQIISSIAMEELALSHVLNAEGEKLQYVLGTLQTQKPPLPPASIDDLLEVNESIRETLSAVSMNQMYLLGKMSTAVNALSASDKDDDKGGGGDDGGDDGKPKLSLIHGEGPYDTRIDEGDWENKNFSMLIKYRLEQDIADPEIVIYEEGAVKLEDILKTNDFRGISVRAENPALNQYFRIDMDKTDDLSIIYNYIPDLDVWEDAQPGLPVIMETLILSKAGYEDARIKVILRYNGSLFTNG
ncbi:MAG: hypothetical protein FWD48_03240 [Oscillospiraceae bacterium]|nr:hypothetical protein [Oscillospiraceae bacterium]